MYSHLFFLRAPTESAPERIRGLGLQGFEHQGFQDRTVLRDLKGQWSSPISDLQGRAPKSPMIS